MAYEQVLSPNTAVTSRAGMCLWFTEEAYGFKPHTGIDSATGAFNASNKKHYDAHPTNVSVPIYLSHYGSYGTPAVYKDWGHYFLYVPGRGYLSSPITFLGPGQQWFKSIDEIVSAILRTAPNSKTKYVGWTEDIAGKVIVKEGNMEPTVQTDDEAAELIRGVFKREPTGGEVASMKGRYWKERIVYLRTSEAGQSVQYKVDGYDSLASQIAELTNVISIKDNEIARLKKENEVLSDKVEAIDNGDVIVITKTSWLGLFDVVKQYFNKLNTKG